MGADRVSRVLVQRRDGEFAAEEDYALWLAFSARGTPVDFYTWDDLAAGRVELARDLLVAGSVRCVEEALRRLRVPPPRPLDLPACLEAYRGRRVWETDFGNLHRQVVRGENVPVFIKPLDDPKAFVGHVVRREADLKATITLPATVRVLASEVVEFASEWRFYVLRGAVAGVGHYAGDPLLFPDPKVVRSAVADFAAECPAAYGLDFGVSLGRTLLVEANDAYAIGTYGLPPPVYADLLEARWLELMRG